MSVNYQGEMFRNIGPLCLSLSVTFTLVYYLQGSLEPTWVKTSVGLNSKGRNLAFSTNISKSWKRLILTNTPTYYDTLIIRAYDS